jgi:Fe2+ or Zn2+ uptake regulation protein
MMPRVLLKVIFIKNRAMGHDPADRVSKRLREAGYRLTQPRRAVVRALLEAGNWLTPEQVLVRARRRCPSLGLVTVYRTLEVLEGLAVIRRLHLDDGCHGFVRSELAHGHHLVCRDCRRVIEFPGSENLAPLVKQVAARTGYVIETHMLELVGLCPRCQTRR